MGRLIDALQELQHEHGYVPNDAARALAERLNVPLYRLQELISFYPHFRTTPSRRVQLSVCRDVACEMARSQTSDAALAALADSPDIEISRVSCLGRCERAPAGAVNDCPVRLGSELKTQVNAPPTMASVYAEFTPRTWACDPYPDTTAHYGTAKRLAATWDADAVVNTLTASGLRGMGGAGFPTGRKWGLVRQQPGPTKYVVCNADESEPGTFKDRVALAELSHLVIEGMTMAGLVIGAEEGIVFIRHEYLPEKQRLDAALVDARQRGVLGRNALGTGRNFDIRVAVSPGGYILGEETALLECLEDKRGEPRNKPPYPGEKGLWGKPTLINNVETFAFVPMILSEGAKSWKARGVNGATGLKLMALSGDVEQPGVYEVPMGTRIGDLIALGGGVVEGKTILALAPGGSSSNFVGPQGVDLELDFDALAKADTMLGSGAVLVVAEGRDPLAIATNVVSFFRNESCGKCVPCRIGSHKAVEMLERAGAGHGSKKQLTVLAELAETMHQTSICGLGQLALNTFTSLLAVCGPAI